MDKELKCPKCSSKNAIFDAEKSVENKQNTFLCQDCGYGWRDFGSFDDLNTTRLKSDKFKTYLTFLLIGLLPVIVLILLGLIFTP